MSTPMVSTDRVLLNGELLDWPMLTIDGSNYVALEIVQQVFPTLRVVPDSQEGTFPEGPEQREENESAYGAEEIVNQNLLDTGCANAPLTGQTVHLPIPMYDTNRIFLSDILMCNGGTSADILSFTYQGIQYVI